MQHPTIDRIERTGFPFSDRREEWGVDALSNDVYTGDEILVYEDEFWLVEKLSLDCKETLEIIGAEYQIAK